MITLDLPFPSRSGKDDVWRVMAGFDIQRAKPGRISGAVCVDIRFEDRRIDLNACAQAVLDLLVIHGVIDRHAALRELRLRRDQGIAGARVSIRPVPHPAD